MFLHFAPSAASRRANLLDIGLVVGLLGRLEVVASNEVRDVIIILIVVLLASLTLLLLHALVALGEFAQRCERVGAELVEDTGDELGQFLVLTDTVDGEGVGGYRGMNCVFVLAAVALRLLGPEQLAKPNVLSDYNALYMKPDTAPQDHFARLNVLTHPLVQRSG